MLTAYSGFSLCSPFPPLLFSLCLSHSLNILVLMSPLLMITHCNVSILSLFLSLTHTCELTHQASGYNSAAAAVYLCAFLCVCACVCVCVCLCVCVFSRRMGDLTSRRQLQFFSGWGRFTCTTTGTYNTHNQIEITWAMPVSS